jgi:hypothetical protein
MCAKRKDMCLSLFFRFAICCGAKREDMCRLRAGTKGAPPLETKSRWGMSGASSPRPHIRKAESHRKRRPKGAKGGTATSGRPDEDAAMRSEMRLNGGRRGCGAAHTTRHVYSALEVVALIFSVTVTVTVTEVRSP